MITFLYPGFLWFLFLATIPIIIHLINLHRYKVVYFSRISFLKKVDTKSRKVRKLHNFWILLLRTLAIVFFVLAFSYPKCSTKEDSSPITSDHLIVFVDNSLSLQAENQEGSLLNQAKTFLSKELTKLSSNVKIKVITHQGVIANNITPEILPQLVQQITFQATTISPEGLANFLQKQQSEHNITGASSDLVILSDFQRNYWLRFFQAVDSFPTHLVFLIPSNRENISVDTVWFDTPYRLLAIEQTLNLKLSNRGKGYRSSIPVRFYVNDSLTAVLAVDLEAGETKDLPITLTLNQEGWYYGRIEIDDFPIVFDNNYYFSFEVRNKRKALLIGEESYFEPLVRLFNVTKNINYRIATPHNVSVEMFDSVTAFFLNQPEKMSQGIFDLLMQRVSNGAGLVLFLGEPYDYLSQKNLLELFKLPTVGNPINQSDVVKIVSLEHPFFQRSIVRVDKETQMPKVQSIRPFNQRWGRARNVLTTEMGNSIMLEQSHGKGKIYLFNTEVFSNQSFSYNPLFVPLFVNMVLFTGTLAEPVFTLTSDLCFELMVQSPSRNFVPRIVNKQGNSIIPRFNTSRMNLNLCLENQIQTDGIFRLMLENNNEVVLAFNYMRTESSMEYLSMDEVTTKGIKSVHVQQRYFDEQSRTNFALWQFFLVISFLCLVLELTLISR